jgi:hypothetical protein
MPGAMGKTGFSYQLDKYAERLSCFHVELITGVSVHIHPSSMQAAGASCPMKLVR